MKPVIIGWILVLFPFTTWGGTFLETFDEGNLENWQELSVFDVELDPASWEILDGELEATMKGRVDAGLPFLLTTGDETWQDYEIKFDVKPLEEYGPALIVVASRITKNWGVVCTIGVLSPEHGSNAHCFGGKLPGKLFDDFGIKKNSSLKLKEWSTLKLRVNKANLTFWINGRKTLESPALPRFAGGVGFGLANYKARFDNIIITGNGIPDKGELSVTPRAKLATTWGQLKRF